MIKKNFLLKSKIPSCLTQNELNFKVGILDIPVQKWKLTDLEGFLSNSKTQINQKYRWNLQNILQKM